MAAYATLAASPLLRYVDYDGTITIAESTFPNDPQYAEQWAFEAVSTLAGWDIATGDPAVVVAVLDTGVDWAHEDLPSSHFWTNTGELDGVIGVDDDGNGYVDDIRGWDWISDDNTLQDANGHGTHVSGVIVAATNNGIGVAGHGGNVKVAMLQVVDEDGSGTISDLVAGLDYALDQGFRIVNLSLIVRYDVPALADAITTAAAEGVIVVTAAGNQNGGVQWPAAYEEALAVGATASDGSKASFSNFGPELDIAAPGDTIHSTYLNNGYRTKSGTSMATPHVSTLAALIWSLRPDLTRAQVINVIISTADDANAALYPGRDDYLGAGQVNFAAALAQASSGLTLIRDDTAETITGPNATVPYPVHVTAPSNLPVVGAVVEAQVTDGSHVPIGSVRRAATDNTGIAAITVSTPITPGSYLVRARVGDAVTFMPLQVLAFAPTPTPMPTPTLTPTPIPTPTVIPSAVDAWVQARTLLVASETIVKLPITYGNRGPTQVRSLTLAITPDSDLVFLGAVPVPTSIGPNKWEWQLGQLSAGATDTVTLYLRMPAAEVGQRSQLLVTVSSGDIESSPSNNRATVVLQIAQELVLPLI